VLLQEGYKINHNALYSSQLPHNLSLFLILKADKGFYAQFINHIACFDYRSQIWNFRTTKLLLHLQTNQEYRMKTQSKYSLADLYKIKQIKREIEDLRKQLLEIDREIGGIKQYINDVEPNQLTNYSQEFSDRNDDSKTESAEEDKEKLWGNYILVILLAFYLVVMSFL
jgi:hypothetical protein